MCHCELDSFLKTLEDFPGEICGDVNEYVVLFFIACNENTPAFGKSS